MIRFNRHRLILLFISSLLLMVMLPINGVFAAPKKWTVEDVLKQEQFTQVNISPDGSKILWVKRYPDFEKDKYLSDIFETFMEEKDTASKMPLTLRLTRTGNNWSPRWSPDGQWIAFLSSRPLKNGKEKKGTQIWIMSSKGGEPEALTQLENGVRSFRWLDNNRIIFSARENKTQYEKELKKAKDDAIVVEDTTLFWPVRLFTIDVKSKKIKRQTRNRFQITEFEPSPDARYVVYSLQPSPNTADARHQPLQYLLDLKTGKTIEIFKKKYFDPENFRWRLDSRGFYASDEYSSDPQNEGAGIIELYYFDVQRMTYEKIPLHWEWAVGFGGYAVTKDGIHVQLADGPWMKPRFYYRTDSGWKYVDVADRRFRNSTSIATGPDGESMVFTYSRPDSIPRYLFCKYDRGKISAVQEIVKLNGYLKKLPIPRAEIIKWVGARGDSVNGILYYPLNYKPGKKHPLVVLIHGGPSGADLDAWRLGWTVYAPIWAEKGAFVLRVNYHGSGNHGLKFVESIKKHYYELEVPDIVKGVKYLIRKGYVDPDSLGVMGWSNGAILTIALTVEHPRMFKVAAPGAGDVDWISDYGNCAFGVRFDDSYFGGPPWKRLKHYIKKSPLFRMERVLTPTIIFFGTEDTSVPTEQGWEHYRALQQIGKAPVRFILFPGQPHGLRRLSHQKRKMKEEIAWFDYYLFGKRTFKEDVKKRVLPEQAPLALLSRMREIKKWKNLYGVNLNGVLVPETIMIDDSLQVGRFEVTRAQFAEYSRDYQFPAGTENYPANAISFEEAQKYVQWLSRKTGRHYRLPTRKELQRLQKMAGSSENNIRYWVGYSPTPDEYQQLKIQLQQYKPDELLMPVGSRPPGNSGIKDKPLIFDTDGNVAEWATDKDGKGVALTGSAVTYTDPKAKENPAAPENFIGFRVVLEK